MKKGGSSSSGAHATRPVAAAANAGHWAELAGGGQVTEQIFNLEGIGKWGLDATYIQDLPVVQATSLILAVAVVLANIFVDVIYSFLDPRVRL